LYSLSDIVRVFELDEAYSMQEEGEKYIQYFVERLGGRWPLGRSQ